MKKNNLIIAGAIIKADASLRPEIARAYKYRNFGVIESKGQISIFGKKKDIIQTMDSLLTTIYQIACPK